jgi:FkbM family methyltransferase
VVLTLAEVKQAPPALGEHVYMPCKIETTLVTIAGKQRILRYFRGSERMVRRIASGESYSIPDSAVDVRTVLDVGACSGISTLYFHESFPRATIHAIEPSPKACEVLRQNVSGLQRVVVHELGLLDSTLSASLYRGIDGPATSSLVRSCHVSASSDEAAMVHAEDFCATCGVERIDVLKIDTEGCEVPILRALFGKLQEISMVYLEYHSERDRRSIDQLLSATHLLFHANIGRPFRGDLGYLHRACSTGQADELSCAPMSTTLSSGNTDNVTTYRLSDAPAAGISEGQTAHHIFSQCYGKEEVGGGQSIARSASAANDGPVSVSVVVPVRGCIGQLGNLLSSLSEQSVEGLEVAVISDGCREVEEYMSTAERPFPLLHANTGCELAFGVALARNLGAWLTTGRLIIFIDTDVLLETSVLEAMQRAFEPNCLLVPRIDCVDRNQPNTVIFPDNRRGFTAVGLPEEARLQRGLEFYTGLAGVDRDSFIEIGGFDMRFLGQGGSDADFGCRHAMRFGRVKYLSSVGCKHLGLSSGKKEALGVASGLSRQLQRYLLRNNARYYHEPANWTANGGRGFFERNDDFWCTFVETSQVEERRV